MKIKLPPVFYWDHVARDLPGGQLLRETKSFVEVELSEEDARELLDDAEYYADPATVREMLAESPGGAALGLQSSARATVKRLRVALGDEAPKEKRTFVFVNPVPEARPYTFRADAVDEASARRAVEREIRGSGSWPLQVAS